MPKSETEQLQFLLSLIKKDIQHYEIQQETVKKWIQQSILSLKHSNTFLLEELRKEYKEKALDHFALLKEFQQTLKMYDSFRKKA